MIRFEEIASEVVEMTESGLLDAWAAASLPVAEGYLALELAKNLGSLVHIGTKKYRLTKINSGQVVRVVQPVLYTDKVPVDSEVIFLGIDRFGCPFLYVPSLDYTFLGQPNGVEPIQLQDDPR